MRAAASDFRRPRQAREAVRSARRDRGCVRTTRGDSSFRDGRARPRRRPRRRRGRLRILVAEDNATNQKLVVALLRTASRHRGDRAATVREAVERSAGEPFDLILMDVQMPDMSGLEATAAIRERERTTGGHIPIVAMTAHAMTGDRERCLEAGMDGYVSKPLRPDALLAAVDGLVANAGGRYERRRRASRVRREGCDGRRGVRLQPDRQR